MAYALVGTIGAVSLGAANTAVTPAWGTSENRTAKNLLICWVAVHATATLPTTPNGWNIGVQKAGTSMSVTAYWRVATGADAAPQIGAMGASTYIQAQLAEFSGGADGAPVANAGVGTAGTTSPIVATLGAIDPTNGTLVVVVGASFYSAAATKTLTHTVTGGAATITATTNNGTSLARHYSFGRGPTTTHASADSDSFAQTTTSITGGAVGLVSFLLGPPVTSAPTAASMTLTGATPTVSAAQTYDPSAAAMTLTGATPTVTIATTSLPTAASMTLTGATPTVTATANVTSVPTAASLTLSGATPTVSTPVVTQPTAASMILTGATPIVTAPAVSQPTAAAMTLTGATPVVAAAQTYAPSAASLTLAGATPAVSAAQTYAPSPAALLLTGATPDVTVGQSIVVQPSESSLTLTGAVPDVSIAVTVLPDEASLTLSGSVPSVTTTTNVTAVPASATLTLVGAVPEVRGGDPIGGAVHKLAYFVAQQEPEITAGDARRERARKHRRAAAQAEAQAVIAVAMGEVLRHQRRIEEDDWLLGLADLEVTP